MRRIVLTSLALMLFNSLSFSQDEKGKINAGGYASWLNIAMFQKPTDVWYGSSMLHNRINLKAYASRTFTAAIEMRNRFIFGDMVKLNQGYGRSLTDDRGFFDLSFNIFSETSFVLNTMIDRAWIEFTAGNFQITAGRQRINWSQALIWNPNDIFNTYSYFDFDYVERPGSDAIRAVYSTSPSSAAEVAIKLDNDSKLTAAALYRFSLFNADLQFFAGETRVELLTAGAGWSAPVGSFSFRGEASLFYPFNDLTANEKTYIVTAGLDKVFAGKITTMVQAMYSSNPVDLLLFTQLYEGGFTADQLAFSEFSMIGQLSYAPVPLVNISLSAIWYPDLKGYFAGPSFDVSLSDDLDFSFVWQHFDSIINGNETLINLGFIRFRYNF